MTTWDDGASPSKEKHKNLANSLSKKTNKDLFTSGCMVLIAYFIGFLLIFITVLIVITQFFGPDTIPVALLLLVSSFSFFQAYNGIVNQEIRFIPRSPINDERLYIGGRMREVVKGKTARTLGLILLIIGIVCFARMIWILLSYI